MFKFFDFRSLTLVSAAIIETSSAPSHRYTIQINVEVRRDMHWKDNEVHERTPSIRIYGLTPTHQQLQWFFPAFEIS